MPGSPSSHGKCSAYRKGRTASHGYVSAVGQDSDDIASMIAVMQALISVFLDDHDKLRSINAGKTRITFLTRSPLYYVCVSSWGEPESVVRIINLSLRKCRDELPRLVCVKQDKIPLGISTLANFERRYCGSTSTDI
jgi:hypothetical protein